MTITSERPGVYVSYQASNVNYSENKKGVVGLVAVSAKGNAGQVYTVNSYLEARSLFGDSPMSRLSNILFQNGVAEIRAVPLFNDSNGTAPSSLTYANAFKLLAVLDEVKILLCDTFSSAVHNEMKNIITDSAVKSLHKIGIVEPAGSLSSVLSNAKTMNCERMLMVMPGAVNENGETADIGSLAAAMAGAILSENDPAVPLNGAELYGLGGVTGTFTESEIDNMVRGGVCPVECINGKTSVIRGVTTYSTNENGETDYTWHELTTVRIVDNVIPEIRDSLKRMFSRAKNTNQTRDSIRTQVVIILEKKLSDEIIDSYGNISVTQDADDPTICNVSFEFAVAHGINKIIVNASIMV